ncbi:hypothetical protein HA149_07010 [Prochlorococcus marinus XMU1406]|uniref:CotH kinase family protein n=1 Tax=Prochlorococcus marinus TaxID=1219 RepID=UPI001ADC3B6B|nr:CotH kinase family protein [Prochlorococcus marinus]MBO8206806.1 hypothetical protein [Prochlorococcus marinus XMU1406]MCR8542625.1 CotH kinase family protein [Prochlorococcus marinus XMU1427]
MKSSRRKSNNKNRFKIVKKKLLSFLPLLKNASFILVVLQGTIFIGLVIDNRGYVKLKISEIYSKFDKRYEDLYLSDFTSYFFDTFRSFFVKKNLKRIDLDINFEEISKLECMRKKLDNCSEDNWARGKMIHNKNSYKVKLRAKGDRNLHRLNLKKMSLKVDIRGKDRYEGMEEFSLQMPILRNYTYELFASNIVKNEDLISPRHEFVKLFVNGEYFGIRHVEEGFGRELIEASKRRYGPIFGIFEPHSVIFEDAIFDLSDAKQWSENTSKKIAKETLSVLKASQNDPLIIKKYFDLDKWGKYFALMDALNLYHATIPKSVKYFLNPSSGLIEPIFFDGHFTGALNLKEDRLIDITLHENCPWECPETNFYRKFFGDYKKIEPNFYRIYFENLERFSSNSYTKEVIKPSWDNFWFERALIYREFSRSDRIYNEGIFPHIGQWGSISKRLKNIRKEIRIARDQKPSIATHKNRFLVSLVNEKSRLPQIIKLNCNGLTSEPIILEKGTKKFIDLSSFGNCNIDNTRFSLNEFKNSFIFSGELTSSLEMNQKIKFEPIIKTSLKQNFNFNKGLHNINENIELFGKNIIFDEGSNICLNKGSKLIIKDSYIKFHGNPNEGVIIKGCDSKSGSLIIENSNVFINNLEVNNLLSPIQELRILYGGINFVNSKIKFDNLEIKNSLSEDGVNFINSSVEGNNLYTENIKSDAIDSDFSSLDIKNINCNKVGNDCLDLSYSVSNIENIVGKNIEDKVLSVGEDSNLNINNINAINSEIGVVSKDSSVLKIKSFNYSNVKLPLASYIKKPELGSPTIYIDKTNNTINTKNSLISDDSFVYIYGKRIIGEMSSNKVFKELYGNKYGAKTIR